MFQLQPYSDGFSIPSPVTSISTQRKLYRGDIDVMWNNNLHLKAKEIVSRSPVRKELATFLIAGKEFRRKVFNAALEKVPKKSVNITAVNSTLNSQIVIYNRIPKTGSASLLCKNFYHRESLFVPGWELFNTYIRVFHYEVKGDTKPPPSAH